MKKAIVDFKIVLVDLEPLSIYLFLFFVCTVDMIQILIQTDVGYHKKNTQIVLLNSNNCITVFVLRAYLKICYFNIKIIFNRD